MVVQGPALSPHPRPAARASHHCQLGSGGWFPVPQSLAFLTSNTQNTPPSLSYDEARGEFGTRVQMPLEL